MAREPGPPDVLELREVETPSPRPDEVLIKVAAAGVNRADLQQRQGRYQPPPGASTIIGLEVSGTVAEVGEEVSNWAVDDPCVALVAGGGYAEYVAAPAGQVVPPPLGVELVAAAAVIEVAATVYSNVEFVGLADGDWFLVHGGAGGIGSFAIQYAKSIGATVITTAGSEDKLRFCRSIGADHAISYHDDWPAAVRGVAADGVHMILDNMGAKYLDDHVQLLATDGALVTIGMQGGRKGTLDLGVLDEDPWPYCRELAALPTSRREGSDLPRSCPECLATDRRQHDQAAPADCVSAGRSCCRARSSGVGQQHRQDHPLGRALARLLDALRRSPQNHIRQIEAA